jgi:hypothetical protein
MRNTCRKQHVSTTDLTDVHLAEALSRELVNRFKKDPCIFHNLIQEIFFFDINLALYFTKYSILTISRTPES